jgi:hypothetical protein
MNNTADVTGGKPSAVLLQSISGVSAINPLVAFYDIHGGKREVLFFYFVPDTTRDKLRISLYIYLTAGWSSGLRIQRSWVQMSRGFCDEQLHLFTGHGCFYVLLLI